MRKKFIGVISLVVGIMFMIIQNKFTNIKWAVAYAIMNFLAGLNERGNENMEDAEIRFLMTFIIILGTGLYYIGKRRKLGRPIWGSKVFEVIFFSTILIFFVSSILSGSWNQDPLNFTVVPVWIILAYLFVFFAKPT